VLIRTQDVMQVAPQKLTILISGTQGEPMSALSRVAVDTISMSRRNAATRCSQLAHHPRNEKAIFRMIDHMARRGADVLYGTMNPPIHVSGHASIEELTLMLNLVRPKYFVPITVNTGSWPGTSAWRNICVIPGSRIHLSRNRNHPGDRREGRQEGRESDGGPRVHSIPAPSTRWGGYRDPGPAHLSEDGIVLPMWRSTSTPAEARRCRKW